MSPSRLASLACVLLPLTALPARAAQGVDYVREVKPILVARCYACHGALKQKSGLRLDTVALMKKGGDNGPVIVPGKSTESPLFAHVSTPGRKRMPPASEGEPLKKGEVALLRAWIDQGAVGPADEKPETDPKDHWAFRPPVRPAVPRVKNPAWVGNPIDAFIAAEHDKRGLVPQRPAEKRILLRRVTLDLIGLPPTTDEVAAFLADDSPRAYEKVVDRLLSSPHYGERWGRHWMDVWRYSDWWGLGAEVRNSQKHIWHWRDWIVESANADAGYDQMVREMLAADELYPTDAARLRGTGFLARPYFLFNRNTWMEEVVEHTSKAFLGLTVNCAKCHDHKYDPIAQEDFYRFRAFFEPYQVRTDLTAGEIDFAKDGVPRAFDCNLSAKTFLFIRGDEKHPRKKPILPGVPAVFRSKLDIRSIALPPEAHSPGLRAEVLEGRLLRAAQQIGAAHEALAQAKRALTVCAVALLGPVSRIGTPTCAMRVEQARLAVAVAEKALAVALLQPESLKASAAADRARLTLPPAADAKMLARRASLIERRVAVAGAEEAVARAELAVAVAPAPTRSAAQKILITARTTLANAQKMLDSPGETYTSLRGALKTLESNLETEASRNKPFPTTSSGRRSALAKWMTEADNPLTARVAVNHIWLRHFGKPLVPTVFDFGRKGTPPTHPELLDWLAVELRESGWSMKHLHRLIVTSNTYCMTSSSATATANRATDPENRAYWRMNSVRMESQAIRDSLLSLAGDLDPTMGGPSVPVNAPTSRRSLYFVHSHNDQQKFLSIFDDASVLECYRRAESILPQQALALQNSRLALAAAEKIAARLDTPDRAADGAFVRAAFETILCQTPTAEEQAECAAALRDLRTLAAKEKRPAPVRHARTALVHALLNHNDFVTIR
jgi:Protein of unknown function (DUF1553)/Protein of unknown function (DUF1549)/Planctomycete cytochrome C